MNNYTQQYTKVGMETEVASADPHRLILMLLTGAIAAITHAKHQIKKGNPSEKGNAITKAINIIGELDASLNMEVGGELALKLRQLYEYMGFQLVEANLHSDLKKLDEVAGLISELKTGWEEISDEAKEGFLSRKPEPSKEMASYGAA